MIVLLIINDDIFNIALLNVFNVECMNLYENILIFENFYWFLNKMTMISIQILTLFIHLIQLRISKIMNELDYLNRGYWIENWT